MRTRWHSQLADCRIFVTETRSQADASKAEMVQQPEALHVKQQDIVKFVDDVPETVAALQEKLNSISAWCSANHLDAMPVTICLKQEKLNGLTAQTDHRLSELSSEIAAARAATGSSDCWRRLWLWRRLWRGQGRRTASPERSQRFRLS